MIVIFFYNLCTLSLCKNLATTHIKQKIYLKSIAFRDGKAKHILKNQDDIIQAKDESFKIQSMEKNICK